MAKHRTYKNVFDDPAEFGKLNELVLSAIQDFTDYRQGNLTYGEIIYVLECILDSLRETSEKEALKTKITKRFGEAPSFSLLLASHARLVETLLKKRLLLQRMSCT
ncbi:hypothetical protein [Chitinivibrio alkaliphilus]|uniref:Uncharacterized protein n=1 Tax=Chitinivibrio alkaliphilus ACht1 TaxID=1313304 RepID=U7D4E5_9BACT|nr:hypothetical protein [Chitinivibrio alkaliphilus]ERP31359.1 hypothetical protein CALK_1704 [Chitinivibrio alkaliphilus ACht1]